MPPPALRLDLATKSQFLGTLASMIAAAPLHRRSLNKLVLVKSAT